ncbi:PQ loop repeat-domain-containing protein [Thelephora terrestris]|uniref:PQ loop repeat-domain-containing protein n=1 Tax=Thelephora terrestris TaxID=56493 RepID=A0A9P6L3A8_9AGAM|nr:PQ loop repeat-domain-containing protein [Thelephora terrestris]
MVANTIAENVLGTIGTICWTAQLIPQIWKSYRSKSTDGLSDWLVFVWAISGPLLGTYAVTQNLNIPLILQPQIFAFLCAVSWSQCLFYGRKWPLRTCIIYFSIFIVLMAGFEVGMVYAVRPPAQRGDAAPLRFFSIASAVTIALGLLPQYWEIYKRKEVIGISMTFMAVDISGGVFSILSLAFKEKFDVFASSTYAVVMDTAIVIAAIILNPIARRKRATQAFEPARMEEVTMIPEPSQ